VVELPAPVDGIVLKRFFEEGTVIHVGDVLVVIGERGEQVPQGASKTVATTTPLPLASPARATHETIPRVPEQETVLQSQPLHQLSPSAEGASAMPHTRKLARVLGVDLANVTGTGPGGRVTDSDVRSAKDNHVPTVSFVPAKHGGETKTVEQGTVEVLPLSGIRKAVAEKLGQSWHSAIHVTLMDEVEVDALSVIREKEKQRLAAHSIKLTFLPFIIKAVIIGLNKYPIFNSEIDMERKEIRVKHFFNVGVAVDTEQGLVVPVIRNCDRKSITEIAIEINDAAKGARERKLPLDELSGSSFSVTNYGSVGARFATPIINPPNTAILGIGRISEQAVVRDGKIVIRKMLPLSFCFDHRVADGAVAAGFLGEVMRHLSNPGELLVDLI
jgi:pyruvate dehydrogenase E2 component (dihydrolipoamide acetyltransferase)